MTSDLRGIWRAKVFLGLYKYLIISNQKHWFGFITENIILINIKQTFQFKLPQIQIQINEKDCKNLMT